MTEMLPALLKIAVASMIFAIGMGSTPADVTYLWRRPALLLRSLLAMYVLVPLAVFLLVAFLPVSDAVKAALLVLAVSAGAPLLPRRLGTFGADAYAFSLVVTSSLLAIIVVPLWVMLLARHFDVAAQLPPANVAAALAKALLGPLALGLAFRKIFPRMGEKASGPLLGIGGIVLAGSGVLLLAIHWEIFLHVGWRGMATLTVVMLVALAIGHALGGPRPEDRTVLAIACSTRHIGIAVLVAATFDGPRTIAVTAVYLVTMLAVSIPYLRWRRRASAEPGPINPPA